MASKLISFIVSGRNDNYMGNFTYRLTTCINYIAHGAKKLGRLEDVEIVVADWNSDVPLAEELPLSSEAAQICRFAVVPPAVAKAVQQPEQAFYITCAVNVAIRRTTGQFIMLINADLLIPHYSLRVLLDLVAGKLDLPIDITQTLFFGGRHHIPWQVVQHQPSLANWDRYLLLHGAQLAMDQGHAGLGTHLSAQLIHRDLWHDMGAYDESYFYWGWADAELNLRCTQTHPWLHLSSIGIQLYDMEHWVENRRAPIDRNPYTVSFTIKVNNDNWGLGNYDLEIQQAKNIVDIAESPPESYHLANWEQTRAEVLAEMMGDRTSSHVEYIQQLLGITALDQEVLYALAWYGLHHSPRIYLEFGAKLGYTAALVAGACPTVEFYGIESWQEDGGEPTPYYATNMLRGVGYQGYARFVTGDPMTALDRLQNSFIGNWAIDLALVRGELLGAGVLEQLDNLIPALVSGGALVFTCSNPELFEWVYQKVGQKFADLTYLRFANTYTFLILKVSLLG